MIPSLGRSAAAPLFTAALTMRMFIGLAVDYPKALNASWMCPIVGLVIFLPLAFALDQAAKLSSQSPWSNITSDLSPKVILPAELIFVLFLLYDAASVLRLTASSSNIIALTDATVHLLIVPTGITACIAGFLGAEAAGNSARIALRLLPFFLIIMLVLQIDSYEAGRLTPILGSGANGIVSGGIYCAGCMALLSLVWLPAQADRNKNGILRYAVFTSVGVSILLIALQMSYPVMPESTFTQAARIELVLSNGRMSLSPQFILNILWFGGLLYLLAAEVSASVLWLKRIFNHPPVWILSVICAVVISVAAIFNGSWLQNISSLILSLFALIGGTISVYMIAGGISRKCKQP